MCQFYIKVKKEVDNKYTLEKVLDKMYSFPQNKIKTINGQISEA